MALYTVSDGNHIYAADINQFITFLAKAHASDGTPLNLFTNIVDKGADPLGIADSTSAINTALAGGGLCYGPLGTYKLTNTLNITSDNASLVGVGDGTILDAAATFPAAPIVWVHAPATGYRYGIGISNLLIRNVNGASGVTGLQLDSTYWARVHHVNIEGVFSTNLYLNGTSTYYGAYTQIDHCHLGPKPGGSNSGGIGLLTNNHEFNTVRDCTFNWFKNTGGCGIKLQNGSNLIEGCTFDENDTSIWVWYQLHNIIQACQFDRGVTQFIYLNGSGLTKITNNSFQGFVGTGSKTILTVDTASNASNNVIGNTVKAATGWTNFVVEGAGTGTPGNLYLGNRHAGLTMTLVSGTSANNLV